MNTTFTYAAAALVAPTSFIRLAVLIIYEQGRPVTQRIVGAHVAADWADRLNAALREVGLLHADASGA